jgi:hypothetical protein
LEEAIRPAELLAGVKVGSIEPKRWWIRPAWPRRLWPPWEWRCYRRPFLVAAVTVAIALLAIILLTLTLSHNISVPPVQADRCFLVGGGKMQQIPPGHAFKARVWRWQTAWLLPKFEPIIELHPPDHRWPRVSPGGADFTLQIQSLDGSGTGLRLNGWLCRINGFPAGDLGKYIPPVSCPMGRYVISIEKPAYAHDATWSISLMGSGDVSVVHEIEQRWHLLNVQPPLGENHTDADPQVLLTVSR